MFVRTVSKRSWQNSFIAAVVCGGILLLLHYPDAVRNGINRGLSVCGSVIIPTLFPFMLVAGALADSPLCRHPGRIASFLARRLFGLPACCAPVIVLSLVGGYPAGMTAIARLYRQSQITDEQLRRMTAFCLCGGPGFIIGTVGSGLMGSTHAGLLLYAAQVVAAVGIGIGLGVGKYPEQEETAATTPPRPFAVMVGDTCGALLTTCGFVAAAAMMLSLAEGMGIGQRLATVSGLSANGISAFLAAVTEVSCGCVALVRTPLSPLWLSLCLSWGGLSIHGQLAAILPPKKLAYGHFWRWRMIHGAISGGMALALFHFFPPDRSTAAGQPSALLYSVSAQSSIMLLVLCFLAMLYFSEKKTGKTTEGVL